MVQCGAVWCGAARVAAQYLPPSARRLSNAASGIKGATYAIAEKMGKVDITNDEELATLVKVRNEPFGSSGCAMAAMTIVRGSN